MKIHVYIGFRRRALPFDLDRWGQEDPRRPPYCLACYPDTRHSVGVFQRVRASTLLLRERQGTKRSDYVTCIPIPNIGILWLNENDVRFLYYVSSSIKRQNPGQRKEYLFGLGGEREMRGMYIQSYTTERILGTNLIACNVCERKAS